MSTDSTVNNTSTVMTPSADQLKILAALEKQVALLRASYGLAPLEGSKPRGGRKSKAAKNDAPAADKPKKEVNDKIKRMNEERMALFDELKRDWATRNPDFASLSDADLKKAVKNGEVEPRPRYPDALKLHSERMKAANPEHAAKAAARRAKIDAKQAATAAAKKGSAPPSVTSASDAASTVSAASGDKTKKRGPKKYSEMTPEELAAAKAKRAAAKRSKKSDANSAPAPAPAPAPKTAPAPATSNRSNMPLRQRLNVRQIRK